MHMHDQLLLPGLEAPKAQHNLFFAIMPDADAVERLAGLATHLRDQHGLTGKLIEKERLHVSLHQVGEFVALPQHFVAMALEAASTVSMPAFELTFDRATSFKGPRGNPFVLVGRKGLSEFKELQQTLGTAMRKAGFKRRVAPGKTPHVTMLYDDELVAEEAVETIAWTAREFVLVHSLLDQSIYHVLARWPLHP